MDVVSLWKGSHVGQKRKVASEVIGAWPGGEKKAGEPADFVLSPAIHPLAIFHQNKVCRLPCLFFAPTPLGSLFVV